MKYSTEVLGHLVVTRDGKRCQIGPAGGTLIALLAVRGIVSKDEVASTLWPDTRREQAAANLRTALARARSATPGLIDATPHALTLAGTTDLAALNDWIHQALTSAEPVPAPIGAIRELLPGWDQPWVLLERERLRVLRLHALESNAAAFVKTGRTGPAAASVLAALALDPLRESAVRLLVEIHLRGGNAVDAVRAYTHYAELLRDELGATPSSGLTSLVKESIEERRVGRPFHPVTSPRR